MNEAKQVINVSTIKLALSVINNLNRLNLENVQLMDDDEPITISQKILDRWKFTGLCNRDFVDAEMWKPESWQGYGDMT